MKCFLLLLAVSFLYCSSSAQTSLEKGNTCYTNKEYQCALDNFLVTLDTKIYKAEERYLLLFYIGKCYAKLKQYPKAIDYFNQSVALKPSDIFNYYGLGDAWYDSGNYSLAVDNYRKAYDLATTAEEKNDMYWWLGKSYFAWKKYAESIAAYKKISSREGTYLSTDVAIGDCFYTLYKFDSAMVYYKKAIPILKPDDAMNKSVTLFIGKCYHGLGNDDMAIQYINDALAKNPKYGLAIWEKGIVFANKKDYLQAISWYKKALEVYSDSSNSYILCGNIAACYQNVKNYTEEFNWQQKRKLFSENKYTEYSNMAVIQYGRLKQPAAAEKICSEAIGNYELEPETVKAKARAECAILNSIAGKIALEKKDTVKAQKSFDVAMKLSYGIFAANAGAGEIAWARKDIPAYTECYKRILKYSYDTLINTRKEIANVYGRLAFIDAYINKVQNYSYDNNVRLALSFDSLQKEAVLLWPIVLNSPSNTYELKTQRDACISVLTKAIKQYASEKEYVSNLYNLKAVITVTADTAGIRKSLEEAIKIYPENIDAWDNALKFYGNYDNASGVLQVEKLIAVLKKKKNNITIATAYLFKGDFLWRVNKKEEAKKAYAEALVWDPKNTTASERSKMQ